MLFALAVAGGAGACQPADECEDGAFSCDGNVSVFCSQLEDGSGGHNVWHRVDCAAGFCRLAAEHAFCALEESPDPLCKYDDRQSRSSRCEGNIKVDCDAGYVTQRTDCEAAQHSGARCLPFELGQTTYAACD